MIPRLYQGFSADRRTRSLSVACLRLLRSSPLIVHADQGRALLDNVAFRGHVAAIDGTDNFFYLSHRHYLARGLTRRQRTALAVHHYRHEVTTFDDDYLQAVYREGGLTLWQETVDGTEFDIVLVPGSDVLWEGGLSVVLRVNGGRVCVLSYSNVDRETIFDLEAQPDVTEQGSTLFVSRKQLAADHGYQRAFNRAFDRCSAAHLCLAAIEGIALVQDFRSLAAVRPSAQPSCTPDRVEQFEVAYGDCWQSLAGTIRGRFAYELAVPMQLTSLDQLTSKARNRAKRRRGHLAAVRQATTTTMRRLLRRAPQLRTSDPAKTAT